MSSAHNLPPRADLPNVSEYDAAVPKAVAYAPAVHDAVPCGAAALHRSRRLSLLSLTAGLCLGLLALTLAQPVSSVRVSPPLAMDMRTLPPPTPIVPALAVPAPSKEVAMTPLLAETSPYSVTLPPPREETNLPKEMPPPENAEKPVPKPKAVKPTVKAAPKLMTTKAEAPKSVAAKPAPPASSVSVSEAAMAAAVSPAAANAVSAAQASATDAGQSAQREHAAALTVLLQAIERHKSYPKQARRTGAQGVVQLMVLVGRDGKVTGWELRQGSGHAVLDSATRQLGEKLAGLDTGVRGTALRIVVPVNYRLS